MSSNTKIVVLRLKAIIYTVICVILGVALIFLLIFMFGKKKDDSNSTPTSSYIPGVYSSSIVLNDNVVDIQVVVDEDHINSVSIVNLEESVATMYPLLEICMDDISDQLSNNVPLEEVTYPSANQYTSITLLNAIQSALNKAAK